ncbi:MAG TPA: hypothetical protein VKV27_09835 [Solirubrobacteraceae bacterium]|nr:hypothetical protein [Solirubrobacteraceae bacterium]
MIASRRRLLAKLAVGLLGGVLILGSALAAIAVEGSALGGSSMTAIVLGAFGCWALDAYWLACTVDRLGTLGREHGPDDDGGLRRPVSGPTPQPRTPSAAAPWSPSEPDGSDELERELAAVLREADRIAAG